MLPVPESTERARAFLDALEADRQAALALSREKAEEAKLIEARLEGFRAAMQILCGQPLVATKQSASETDEPGPHSAGRRTRRRIPELIARELSFSGQPMTARQIAKAIEYTLERTETALSRMEKDGQVHRDEADRWSIGIDTPAPVNGDAARGHVSLIRVVREGARAVATDSAPTCPANAGGGLAH
jgi:cell division septum initiation protein DivIVA